MAFLRPQTLTCPSCGQKGKLTWLVGAGPVRGDGPFGATYVKVRTPGIWTVETIGTAPGWTGRILCPACHTIVKQAPRPDRAT